MIRLLRLIIVVGAAWSAACAECRVNADCPVGNVCFAAECRPFSGQVGCETDDDCEPGLRCESDNCARTFVSCTGPSQCRSGESCTGERCVNAARACEVDQDCDLGAICVGHECTEDGSCSNDLDCDVDELCEDDRCQRFECEAPDDCPRGDCIDESCID